MKNSNFHSYFRSRMSLSRDQGTSFASDLQVSNHLLSPFDNSTRPHFPSNRYVSLVGGKTRRILGTNLPRPIHLLIKVV